MNLMSKTNPLTQPSQSKELDVLEDPDPFHWGLSTARRKKGWPSIHNLIGQFINGRAKENSEDSEDNKSGEHQVRLGPSIGQ